MLLSFFFDKMIKCCEVNFSTIILEYRKKVINFKKKNYKIIVFSLFRYAYTFYRYSRNNILPRVQSAFYDVLAAGSSFVRVSVEYPFTFQPSPSRRFLFLERFSACRLPFHPSSARIEAHVSKGHNSHASRSSRDV